MHDNAHKLMQKELERIDWKNADVLDVGSLDVNGTYKDLIIHRGWKYTGLDLVKGKNVDVVSKYPYRYPFNDNQFDVVISGSTMEHVVYFWLWFDELVRITKRKGFICIITHWYWREHRHPLDCWRILTDGMECLFNLTNQLEKYHIEKFDNGDIIGSAFKK